MRYLPGSMCGRGREKGNILVVSFLLVTLLTALATAHFATVQKNSRQSLFMNDLAELRRYAQTGTNLALHELTYDTGGTDGMIGTELWTAAGDYGRDGYPSTGDDGEGDGIPTPGEPNLAPAAIGPAGFGIRLLVWTTDTAWPNVKRIVSTAYNNDTQATVELYVRAGVSNVPGVGAVFAQPGVVLDLNGNSFLMDGHDKNPDGTPGPGAATYGIATSPGNPPGTNSTELVNQVPGGHQDQIIGQGGDPSIGETAAMDFDAVFNAFKASKTAAIMPGTYSNPNFGDNAANDYRVTYVNGDLHLTGDGRGAGVLIVEGSLTITGRFEFVGVVIVKGDVKLSGGGSGVHIWGSLMIGQTFTAVDPSDLGFSGSAEVDYSTAALAKASSLLGTSYTVLYYNNLR